MWTIHENIVKPTGAWWNKTHCMLPTPEHIEGPNYRIYYGGRNDQNQSHIGYADINLDTLAVSYCDEPVLSPGRLGCFDDNGVLPSCVTPDTMYYIGFKPGGTTRFSLLAGVFINNKRLQFIGSDIGIATAPWIIGNDDNVLVYYVDGVEWLDKDTPSYNIKVSSLLGPMADCIDGYITKKYKRKHDSVLAIGLCSDEVALARPYVIEEDSLYKMFFSAKGRDELYRPQYAESKNGYTWERKPYNFPLKNMCYMILINHGGKEFMFYNDAETYGRDGISLAVR